MKDDDTVTDSAYTLTLLPGSYAICRLAPDSAIPDWALGSEDSASDFVSISRTREDLSIVCPEVSVPADLRGAQVGRGRRCLRVEGPFDLNVVGVLAALAQPLAEAGIAIFVVSTYDTDYVLLREDDLDAASSALTARRYTVVR